jgi:HK97 gp10 family phage protein
MASLEAKGFKEFEDSLLDLAEEFGTTKARRSLLPGLKSAMEPVKAAIKGRVPVDTGKLQLKVRNGAKVATRKDKNKKYLSRDTVAFGFVDVGVGYRDEKGEYRPAAEAIEFGTAEQPARPFIRNSFQSMASSALDRLGSLMSSHMDLWAAKQRAKVRK